jgi:hypothetical protein
LSTNPILAVLGPNCQLDGREEEDGDRRREAGSRRQEAFSIYHWSFVIYHWSLVIGHCHLPLVILLVIIGHLCLVCYSVILRDIARGDVLPDICCGHVLPDTSRGDKRRPAPSD